MPKFSKKSKTELDTCDERLQDIFNEVIRSFDCTIIEGRRDKKRQDKLFKSGKSKVFWPMSSHNAPVRAKSKAVDVCPYPIDWGDRDLFTYFAGFVMGVAAMKGILLRWGGDWNNDKNIKNNKFDDLAHFELRM